MTAYDFTDTITDYREKCATRLQEAAPAVPSGLPTVRYWQCSTEIQPARQIPECQALQNRC